MTHAAERISLPRKIRQKERGGGPFYFAVIYGITAFTGNCTCDRKTLGKFKVIRMVPITMKSLLAVSQLFLMAASEKIRIVTNIRDSLKEQKAVTFFILSHMY